MRVRRCLSALIALAALASSPGTASAAVTGSGLGIRLLDAPSDRKDDPRARVYIVDHVAPGATFTRHLEVSNDGPDPRHVELYPDAAAVADDAFVVEPGRTPNELTSWITVSPAQLDLAAREKRTVTVTVAVPKNATSGERYAAILAEIGTTASEGLLQASRVGIRTYLSVGSGAEPPSDFTITSLTAARNAAGAPQVKAVVHNTGGRALDMRGVLQLTEGPGGLSAGPFPATLGSTLAPGDTQPVVVTLSKALPAGPWKAQVDLSSGLLRHSATATITFPSQAGTAAAPVTARAVTLPKEFPVLASLAGVLVSLIVVTLGGLTVRQRRRRLRGAAPAS